MTSCHHYQKWNVEKINIKYKNEVIETSSYIFIVDFLVEMLFKIYYY